MKAYLRTRKNAKCYYCLLKWNENGIWHSKEVSTDIPIKGANKRKAEKKCEMLRLEYEDRYENRINSPTREMLFGDYMLAWLEDYKPNIRQSTYESYINTIKNSIAPYFNNLKITVEELEPQHIRSYYQYLLSNNLSPNSVKHHHANISKALSDLVYDEIIPSNPASKVRLPKAERYTASFYTDEELKRLLSVISGERIEPAIVLAVYYGLRRSEICGLKWSSVNFQSKTIEIRSTVVKVNSLIKEDKTKSESSHRTLPLLRPIEKCLKELKSKQIGEKELFGREYLDSDYVMRWEDGRPIGPDYVSKKFRKILKKYNMRIIRFHDLRHSCASLLIANGVDMKVVQAILGHSDFSTTANIYAHLTNKAELTALTMVSKIFTET